MKHGKVILVGAGPGDPGLLTIKGRKALQEAQVVIYDRLVSPEILALVPEDAERINVGKEADHHPVPQDQINELLLQKALEGKYVVRLKGGDPFLFGRGGEELELLSRHGVDFQEIPGITSAIAAPACAGIPVTHRDFCSSVHIITGHQRAGKPLHIHFPALVQTEGTLIFLMGVGSLPGICQGLLEAGMDPDMPAATVERGTRPDQRVTLATVATLPQVASQHQVRSPATIIVGRVCSLSEDFNWFDRLPLKGKTVIVTRPKNRAGTISDRLRAMGARVAEFPCIETRPLPDQEAMDAALAHMEDYSYLVFTSAAGVKTAMEHLFSTGRDVRALGSIRLAAIGPGTDAELRRYGLCADLIPTIHDGAHLGALLCDACPRGRVLILRAQWGSEALTEALTSRGIPFDDVHCYETHYTARQAEEIRALLTPDTIIAFTSASTVRGFVGAMGDVNHLHLRAACIGQQTAAEAQKHGFSTVTASSATIDALIDCIGGM